MATSKIAVVRFCFLVTPRKWDYVNLHRRDRKTYIGGKLLHQDWAIQPGILFCTHHNPFESRSMPLAPPDLSKERVKIFNLSLDIWPPNDTSLDVWNFEYLSASYTKICKWNMLGVASTFATFFDGYNLKSSHFTHICLLCSNKWVNFPIIVDLST